MKEMTYDGFPSARKSTECSHTVVKLDECSCVFVGHVHTAAMAWEYPTYFIQIVITDTCINFYRTLMGILMPFRYHQAVLWNEQVSRGDEDPRDVGLLKGYHFFFSLIFHR